MTLKEELRLHVNLRTRTLGSGPTCTNTVDSALAQSLLAVFSIYEPLLAGP